MKCPFKVGDKVKHKGSGETAVVTSIQKKCYDHTMSEHAIDGVRQAMNKPPKYGPCTYTFTGYVYVEYKIKGYSKKVRKVKAVTLEKVE